MARSMWRGAIQFGLVTIPVKLYLATEARGGLAFHLLHKTCLTRIQMKTYCPFHEEMVSRTDTVRGYEWSKGKYVVIEEEDLESVPLKTVRAIEIELFVDARRDAHGAQFVKQAYYLEPEAIGRRAFYLLKSVLDETGKSAICKVVIKDREALAALNPYSSTMLLTTLYWPDEVRAIEDLELPEEEIVPTFKPAERRMAEQLVAAMSGEFTADAYRDDYRQALMAVIEAKIEGQAPVEPPSAEPPGRLIDLMAALEASVAAAKESRHETAEPAPARPRRLSATRRAAPAAAASDGRPSRAKKADGRKEPAEAPVVEVRPQRAERRRKTA